MSVPGGRIGEEDLSPAAGWVAQELAEEFPGLRLDWISWSGGRAPSSRAVVRRLHELASRQRGASVVAMRTQPIPLAYRTFFRQIGLDPDVDRIPSEEAALARLLHGGYRAQDLIDDALLIALLETGVPVWAIDGDLVEVGGLGIRGSAPGEGIVTDGDLEPGTLVVADSAGVHGQLFGSLVPGHEVTRSTQRIVLFSVGVDGVPGIHVEEALWGCVEALNGG